MADLWLPLEDRLALWDPVAEQVRVTGWRPGPAGISSFELVPGLRASVDHASPTTLTDLTIDVDRGQVGGDTHAVLTRLLGEPAADLIRRLPALGPQDRPTPIRDDPRSRRGRPDEWSLQPGAEQLQVALAQLLLTADFADDAGLSEIARAAALLDATAHAGELGLPIAADLARRWDPLESTCRHASLSIL